MDIKALFGKNLKTLRLNAGLTQSQLAKSLGLKEVTVSNIERGIRFITAETLEKICKALKSNPSDLFKI